MDHFNYHDLAMVAIFIIGYLLIIFEHAVRIDKATTALLTGISCWVIQYHHFPEICGDEHVCLGDRLSSVSQIVFFLLGALTIVEVISAHKGFSLISDSLQIKSKRLLLWVIAILTFFLSAVLDNLTTTIVMVTLLSKIVESREDRLLIGGAIVVAANAGGAWTPIGDVTTTMLWIGGQLTTWPIMRDLFVPSVICCTVSIAFLSLFLKGNFQTKEMRVEEKKAEPFGTLVLILGIAALVFVPVFKIVTGLPPFMGVFLGLSVLWVVTDLLHGRFDDRNYLRVPHVMSHIDVSSLLFFVGILLAIDALEAGGLLHSLAAWFDYHVDNTAVIASSIGMISAIVDNVPLVAASMGMYSLSQYPPDHAFWQLIAYCAGTGGSLLIIGSAAGIVFMGIEKATFGWYLKRITLPAFFGYIAGIIYYLTQQGLPFAP